MSNTWVNWGRNQKCAPDQIARPSTDTQVAKLVCLGVAERKKVRAVGAGHSFSPLCATEGIMIDLSNFNSITRVDQELMQVTVGAGIRLFELNKQLELLGLALPNLGDIDCQSLAGAISTGTHGTGLGFHSISEAVVGIKMITGDGGILQCSSSKNQNFLEAARVGLGSLGIMVEVTLQCVPAFNLRAMEQTTHIESVLELFEAAIETEDHTEIFWFPHTEVGTLKINSKTTDSPSYRSRYKAFLSDEIIANGGFELINRYAKFFPSSAQQMLEKQLATDRKISYVAPSYKVFCSKRRVRFIEMEYAIPLEYLLEAFQKVREATQQLDSPITFPIEVRVLGADSIPLSPAYGRKSGYIAVHVFRGTPTDPYFRLVEDIMKTYGGRPHWGKMHTRTSRELSDLYPEWNKFQSVLEELDPDGHFSTPYLDRVLRG
ncbi:MAG: D-arabinono-1,4-lactone oxidase [Acidimicrobiales bacterium]|nr:D-arabinono-1,4-lactone oxidase [Acidimicrobiales bacterium]